MITQIHHKKNELQEVEFFEDKECTEAFDFMDKKHLHIELKYGDITPLVALKNAAANWQKIYTPYIANKESIMFDCTTLDDITPNLSKYIPKDNAVLFLSEEDMLIYQKGFYRITLDRLRKDSGFPFKVENPVLIFLHHGTQSELQKANEVAKELKEKYGVEEVNLFMLHCFVNQDFILNIYGNSLEDSCLNEEVFCNINKIITTNSTGILKPEDSSERLQVIDAQEIFEEYSKENNL